MSDTSNPVTRAVLVYQAGIANVFGVASFNLADYGRDATRLYQGDFRTAEAIATGLAWAGVPVVSLGCNMAGDIRHQAWSDDLGPFRREARPVFSNLTGFPA